MGASRTFAEFFAGIGLVRMGLERAGWSVAFANDICEQKRRMYEAHFGPANGHFSTADIHHLSPDDIPTVGLATASFPCTDLSLAGGRRGLNSGESSAFWGFYRLLAEMKERRPPLVLLENVTGFLTSHGGDDFRAAMTVLNELGYAVDPLMLDARWFTPQSRPRLFIVATRFAEDTGAADEISESPIRPAAVVAFVRENPQIQWRIRRLPSPPQDCPRRLADILDDLDDEAPEWWSRERAEYLYNQMSDRHREIADRMIAGRAWSYGAVFRRVRQGRSRAELRTDGLAGCLRTPKGGSGRQILFQAGYGKFKVRLLTPNECARLMGADGYRVTVPLNQALFGFGDAVCVPAIEWIAQNYLNPLTSAPKSMALDVRT